MKCFFFAFCNILQALRLYNEYPVKTTYFTWMTVRWRWQYIVDGHQIFA